MRSRVACLLAGLTLAVVGPVGAQSSSSLAARPAVAFDSWQPAAPLDRVPVTTGIAAGPRHRERNALIGGAIGAVTGVAFCTVISTLANDSADGGVSFCPADSNILLGSAGFVLGFAIGWAI
jgi:hypothetical protein